MEVKVGECCPLCGNLVQYKYKPLVYSSARAEHVWYLRMEDNCTFVEISRRLGVSITTVRKLFRDAGGKLRLNFDADYYAARCEHAWFLRMEGLTFKAIGQRLGVGTTAAQTLFNKFVRRMCRAVKKTHWRWEKDNGLDTVSSV